MESPRDPFSEALASIDVYGEPRWLELGRRVTDLLVSSGSPRLLPLGEVFDLVEAGSAKRYGVPEAPRMSEREATEALLSAWMVLPAKARAGILDDDQDDELVRLLAAAERETSRRTAAALEEGAVFNDGEAGERVPEA